VDNQRRLVIATAALFLFGAASLGFAAAAEQNWPTRPVKLLVSRGAGSGADIAARLLAERLSVHWGQTVVVENRPGGDSVVAINALLAAQDDHMLLYTPASSITAHPYQNDKPAYDMQALLPVAQVSNTTIGFAISPALGAESLADFMEIVRAQPGKLNFSTGTGLTDMILEGFFKSAGLSITRVPYKNVTAPMTDLGEGRIHAYVAGLGGMTPYIQSGKARLVAVLNAAQAQALPNVPTVAESGFPALTFDGLVGVFGHRGMATTVQDRIAGGIRAALAEPDLAQRFDRLGAVASPGDAAAFAAALKRQSETLAKLAAAAGIAPSAKY
jgi:tripartite-type tricarboxylate transporter receptor subunit TctC